MRTLQLFNAKKVCLLSVSTLMIIITVQILSAQRLSREWPYRHELSGVIVDEQNQPIQDAVIYMPPGESDDYRKTTDDKGRFLFEARYLSGPSDEERSFVFVIEHSDYETKKIKVTAHWIDDYPKFGYIKNNIVIQLSPIE